jgi:hypothetical protein
MKTKTIYLTVRVDYSYDENKTNELDSEYIAESLAIRPNYNSVVEGVRLDNVEVCGNNED